jgi:SAM-dependent methyltransferase
MTAQDVLDAPHRWYHTVDLAPDVATPGWVDLRAHVGKIGLPARLEGRALDVGMFDGFWAFELERRGAQVVGIDVDEIPPPDAPRIHYDRVRAEALAEGLAPGHGFAVLKDYFGSAVERVVVNVMHLTDDAVGGPVDFAFVGALLLHLRDPVGALENVLQCVRPGGRLVCYEPVTRPSRRDRAARAEFRALRSSWTWWYPNAACLQEWVQTAGFSDVHVHSVHTVTDATGETQHLASVHARRS